MAAPPALAVLGVSHLVLAEAGAGVAEQVLESLGYRTHGAVAGAPNPSEKAPFIAGRLAPTFSMRVLVSTRPGPAIELLVEDGADPGPGDGATAFEALLGAGSAPGVGEVLAALGTKETVVVRGVRSLAPGVSPQGVVGMIIRSAQPADTLALWRSLGFRAQPASDGVAMVNVPGATPSSRLTVYVTTVATAPPPTSLNQAGLVCLSFWCPDVERLRERLTRLGYHPSPTFTLNPLGRPLLGMFVRNRSGELYEFLAPERPVTEDER